MNHTVLYNAMIHPFTRMSIKGIIWYQGNDDRDRLKTNRESTCLGEYNANINRNKYNCTFPKMIEYLRAIWHERTNSTTDPHFPFGFVQVNSFRICYSSTFILV